MIERTIAARLRNAPKFEAVIELPLGARRALANGWDVGIEGAIADSIASNAYARLSLVDDAGERVVELARGDRFEFAGASWVLDDVVNEQLLMVRLRQIMR